MKNLPNRIYVSMEGGDCILAVKPSDSLDFTGADYDFIDKQLFPLEEGEGVEYVCKDAFIEEVCKYLKENCTYTHPRKGTPTCAVNLTLLKEYLEDKV